MSEYTVPPGIYNAAPVLNTSIGNVIRNCFFNSIYLQVILTYKPLTISDSTFSLCYHNGGECVTSVIRTDIRRTCFISCTANGNIFRHQSADKSDADSIIFSRCNTLNYIFSFISGTFSIRRVNMTDCSSWNWGFYYYAQTYSTSSYLHLSRYRGGGAVYFDAQSVLYDFKCSYTNAVHNTIYNKYGLVMVNWPITLNSWVIKDNSCLRTFWCTQKTTLENCAIDKIVGDKGNVFTPSGYKTSSNLINFGNDFKNFCILDDGFQINCAAHNISNNKYYKNLVLTNFHFFVIIN